MLWEEFFRNEEINNEAYQRYIKKQEDARDKSYEEIGEALEKHGIINPKRARLSSLES